MTDDDRAAAMVRAQAAIKRADATLASPRTYVDGARDYELEMRGRKMSNQQSSSAASPFMTRSEANARQDATEEAIRMAFDRHTDSIIKKIDLLADQLMDLAADIETRLEARVSKLEQEIRALNAGVKTDEGSGDAN